MPSRRGPVDIRYGGGGGGGGGDGTLIGKFAMCICTKQIQRLLEAVTILLRYPIRVCCGVFHKQQPALQ